MTLVLQGVRLPLAHFELRVDAVLEGRVTAIFGASGAGKTSLLEVIAGLRRQQEGTVRIDDRVLADANAGIFLPPERREIGYVPQDGALFPHLPVRKNLLYGVRARGGETRELTVEHVTEVLEIGALLDRAVATLSGGEKQRVALGRALLTAPRLLLLDEPLAGLDAPLRERLMPYLARIRDEFKRPMIYISHSPDEVVGLCDDVVVLERGQIVKRGTPSELFTISPAPRYVMRS